MSKSTAVLSSSDVLNAQLAGAKVVEARDRHQKSYFGGDLLGNLMNVGKDIMNLSKNSFKVGQDIAPMLMGAGPVGGRRRKARRGGDMIDRDELRENIEEYRDY